MELKKILIVDDEAAILVALAGLFQLDGYSVVICASGQEALEKWTDDITHVVSDVQMPGISGVELSQKLLKKNSKLVIVLLTGNSCEVRRILQNKKQYGLRDVLAKPVLFKELKEALGLT